MILHNLKSRKHIEKPSPGSLTRVSGNTIDLKNNIKGFRDPRFSFSVSSRYLTPDMNMRIYLKLFYLYCGVDQIESVFGSTTMFSPILGGRIYQKDRSMNSQHLAELSESGIGIALTLTNHFFTPAMYNDSMALLEEHHIEKNSIICTNDDFARQLKKDFPKYELRASIIKNLNTRYKICRALDLYDVVVVPMDKNDDDAFLQSLPEKDRIMLFGNANCAYTCPARSCYLGFSQAMAGKTVTSSCSKSKVNRLEKGPVFFNLKKFADMGFRRIKLIPIPSPFTSSAVKQLSLRSRPVVKRTPKREKTFFLCSYPRCGRTWLRFILANYFNLIFDLKSDIDLNNFFRFIPNDSFEMKKGLPAYAYEEDSRIPLILASHDPYNPERMGKAGLICLVRGIPDVVVSDFFHQSVRLNTYRGDLTSFVRSSKGGFQRYLRYLNQLAPLFFQQKGYFLTYEQLYLDPVRTMTGVLNTLKIPAHKDMLVQAVHRSEFKTMARLEQERGMPGMPPTPDKTESSQVRKGIVGGCRQYMTEQEISELLDRAETCLSRQAIEMLHRLGLWQRQNPLGEVHIIKDKNEAS